MVKLGKLLKKIRGKNKVKVSSTFPIATPISGVKSEEICILNDRQQKNQRIRIVSKTKSVVHEDLFHQTDCNYTLFSDHSDIDNLSRSATEEQMNTTKEHSTGTGKNVGASYRQNGLFTEERRSSLTVKHVCDDPTNSDFYEKFGNECADDFNINCEFDDDGFPTKDIPLENLCNPWTHKNLCIENVHPTIGQDDKLVAMTRDLNGPDVNILQHEHIESPETRSYAKQSVGCLIEKFESNAKKENSEKSYASFATRRLSFDTQHRIHPASVPHGCDKPKIWKTCEKNFPENIGTSSSSLLKILEISHEPETDVFEALDEISDNSSQESEANAQDIVMDNDQTRDKDDASICLGDYSLQRKKPYGNDEIDNVFGRDACSEDTAPEEFEASSTLFSPNDDGFESLLDHTEEQSMTSCSDSEAENEYQSDESLDMIISDFSTYPGDIASTSVNDVVPSQKIPVELSGDSSNSSVHKVETSTTCIRQEQFLLASEKNVGEKERIEKSLFVELPSRGSDDISDDRFSLGSKVELSESLESCTILVHGVDNTHETTFALEHVPSDEANYNYPITKEIESEAPFDECRNKNRLAYSDKKQRDKHTVQTNKSKRDPEDFLDIMLNGSEFEVDDSYLVEMRSEGIISERQQLSNRDIRENPECDNSTCEGSSEYYESFPSRRATENTTLKTTGGTRGAIGLQSEQNSKVGKLNYEERDWAIQVLQSLSGLQEQCACGNMDSVNDWGYSYFNPDADVPLEKVE